MTAYPGFSRAKITRHLQRLYALLGLEMPQVSVAADLPAAYVLARGEAEFVHRSACRSAVTDAFWGARQTPVHEVLWNVSWQEAQALLRARWKTRDNPKVLSATDSAGTGVGLVTQSNRFDKLYDLARYQATKTYTCLFTPMPLPDPLYRYRGRA